MKLLPSLLLAALPSLAACRTDPVQYNNHWRVDSVPTSLTRHFLNGYNPHEDGSYRDFQWRNKEDINVTIFRHVLNRNPTNPMEPEVSWYGRERPPHSLVPYVWDYMHIESIVWGAIMLNPSTAVFAPIPVGSVLGTLEPGGPEEFAEGFRQFFGKKGAVTASFHDDGNGNETLRAAWLPMEVDPGPGR